MFHLWSKRYYVLSGNCMYYYKEKQDISPKGVIFLTGSIIEAIKDEKNELRGYYGFELLHQDMCMYLIYLIFYISNLSIYLIFLSNLKVLESIIDMKSVFYIAIVRTIEMFGYLDYSMLHKLFLLKKTML